MEHFLEIFAFSNDLFEYVGEQINVPTQDFLLRTARSQQKVRFNRAIGRAIWGLSCGSETIGQISREMEKKVGGGGGTENFAALAVRAAAEYFPRGYGHCEFIAYCAAVVGTTVHLFAGVRHTDEFVFEVAAGVIATVLNGHAVASTFDCSEKAWQELTEVAEKFNEAFDSFFD